MSNTNTEYIYKSTLKTTYGLPDSWIARLGQPDKAGINPHYKSGPPTSLYLRQRVEEFIETNQAEYDQMIARRTERQASGKATADKRAAELLGWASAVEVKAVGELPETLEELERRAELSYLGFMEMRGRYDAVFSGGYGSLIAYLRHTHTNYERLLSEVEGKPGCNGVYPVIKQRCNELAERVYQELTGPAPEDQQMVALGESVAPRLPGF